MATLKTWMQDHNGQLVSTYQTDKRTGREWRPGPREVDATRATYVTLNGSRRDYSGMRVMESSGNVITVADDWHVVTYMTDDVPLVVLDEHFAQYHKPHKN